MDFNIYSQLLAKSLIKPIQSESDYDIAISEVDVLMHKELSIEEETLLSLWAIVIEDYENKHYSIEPKTMNTAHVLHLSKHSIDLATIQLIQWDVSEKSILQEKDIKGTRIYLSTHCIFLHENDPDYLEDRSKLSRAVGR